MSRKGSGLYHEKLRLLRFWLLHIYCLRCLQVHCLVLAPCSLLAQQVTCLSSDCLPGTYSSVSTTAIGDLRLGSDVCVPCHPLCEVCTGPGTQWPTECRLCRYATHASEGCVESCNTTSGETSLGCTDVLITTPIKTVWHQSYMQFVCNDYLVGGAGNSRTLVNGLSGNYGFRISICYTSRLCKR